MQLYILTHGRVDRQVTYAQLPPSLKERAVFVVQECEQQLWVDRKVDNILVLPPSVTNLHQTRQYLLDNVHTGKALEMDDDIVFSVRRTDDPTKFGPMQEQDYYDMFTAIGSALDNYKMVGVVAREGANRNTDTVLVATRQMRLHAYDAEYFKEHNLRWDMLRSPGPEDFAMILQLLTRGEANCVLNQWCQNQGSNTSGGCSTYRTLDVHHDACHHLAELFPDFVKTVRKKTKGAWGGQERTDVIIQWKKALAHGE